MTGKILMIHSFRRGTGKSTMLVNLSSLMAISGRRVCLIDANFQSPSLHILLGLNTNSVEFHCINDVLLGKCEIGQAVYDISHKLNPNCESKVFLVPASSEPHSIAQILKHGYDTNALNDAINRLSETLKPDIIMIDSHSGLTLEAFSLIAISDAAIILMRPDRQDYHGTGILLDVIHKLEVPNLMLIVNEVPVFWNSDEVKNQIEQTFDCEVTAVLHHTPEMMLPTCSIFTLQYPNHPLTRYFRSIVNRLESQNPST